MSIGFVVVEHSEHMNSAYRSGEWGLNLPEGEQSESDLIFVPVVPAVLPDCCDWCRASFPCAIGSRRLLRV